MKKIKAFTLTPNDGIGGRSILTLFTPKKKRHLVWGFTLIETLIYIGIFSVVAVSLTGILWNTLRVNSNQQAANEVDENLRYVMSVLNEKVRGSTAIDSATSSTLVLKNVSYENVTFSVTDGVLYLQEGAGTPVAVTSNKVLVDALTFTKIDMTGAKDGVRVDITLSYNSDKPELAFSKNMISSVNRAAAITFDSDILPNADSLYSIGSSNPRWKNGYFSGDLSVEGNEILTGDFTVDTNTLYVNSASGYVGIGTISPQRPLHIVGADGVVSSFPTSAMETRDSLIIENNNNSNIALIASSTATSYLKFFDENSTNTTAYVGYSHNGDTFIIGSNLAERLRISSVGYVGIATTTPTEMLEVNGNIRLSGGTATYKIKNVATPTDSSDVATKGYVDAAGTTYTQYVAYYLTAGSFTWTNPNGSASTTVSVVVVGGGGGGGGGGGSISGITGSTGGTTSFGSLVSSTGGVGGVGGLNTGWNGGDGGAGYSMGQAGSAGLLDNMLGLGGGGGVGFQGCGNGGGGGQGSRNGGGGGGSGYTSTYYGVTASATLTVTVGAGGGGGALGNGENGANGSAGCVIVYWWDN